MLIDEKTLAELKLAQARMFQQMYASQDLLNRTRLDHERMKRFLTDWEDRLLPIARRYRNNPLRFCEKVMGKEWFTPPPALTASQVQQFAASIPEFSSLLIAPPADLGKIDGRNVLGQLQRLAGNPPGRKRLRLYEVASQLRKEGISVHEICLRLLPSYRQMSPYERRNARERVRSGMARLERGRRCATGPTK